MTNSYDVAHGLSQDAPGPLEPVEIAQQDDTLARTGNTARDWELTCHKCDGSGHVYVKHQVAERKTDIQEFKEECECCEGRGFVFAFQDIPGIEEYVKTCRPAPAAGDALDAVDVDWQLLRETAMLVRDRFSAALSIAYASSDATMGAIRRAHETHEALLAMLDAAIAAQRKGDA